MFQELVTKRSSHFDPNSDQSTSDVPNASSSTSEPNQTKSNVSPTRRKEELHEKLALLNSRYVCKGEKQEKSSPDSNTSKVGLAAIQDMAALQEAALNSEDITPTNDKGFLRYDPNTNRLTLEQDRGIQSPVSPISNSHV